MLRVGWVPTAMLKFLKKRAIANMGAACATTPTCPENASATVAGTARTAHANFASAIMFSIPLQMSANQV